MKRVLLTTIVFMAGLAAKVPCSASSSGTFAVTNQPIVAFAEWATYSNVKTLLGDFNGDGKTDIALTGPSGWWTVPVAFSNGGGTFNVTNYPVLRGSDNFADWASAPGVKPLAGDFNGDGKTDIALTGASGWWTVPVAFSNGDGTFNVTNDSVIRGFDNFADWSSAPGTQPLAADFNGDGKTDIALTGASGWSTIPVAFSNGDGTFNITNSSALSIFGNFAAWASTPGAKPLIGDFNGDGKIDILLTGASGWTTIPVALSKGDGTFDFLNRLHPSFAGWASTPEVKFLVGDFNHDGKTDVALSGSPSWYTLPVAFSNGDGTFNLFNEPSPDFARWASAGHATLFTGDFNHDGKSDIALTGPAWSGPPSILPVAFSNGNGTFDVTHQSIVEFADLAAIPGAGVLVGDFNGDGRTDVALTGAPGWTTLPVAFSLSQ